MPRKLSAAAELRSAVARQPKVGQDLKAKPIVPLGCTKPRDRNQFYIKEVVDRYVKADESLRQEMLVGKIIDSVIEEGELIPVVEKTLDDAGVLKNYIGWTGPTDLRMPIVLETRSKKDGTPYANIGKPVRPWWGMNIFGISTDDQNNAILVMAQIGGESVKNIDLGKIPWFKPCEILVGDDWSANITSRNQDFIRMMSEADAKQFLGISTLDEVDLKELVVKMKNFSGGPVFTEIANAPRLSWNDFYCSDVHLYARQYDTGQTCDVIDISIDPTQPVTCRFYPQNVVEQLANATGGAYALLFYSVSKPREYRGKVQNSLDIYGALVYEYDHAVPPGDQP